MLSSGTHTHTHTHKHTHKHTLSHARYTNWAIGAGVASLIACVVQDHKRVVPVSTDLTGLYGVEEDIFLSLPCVLGRHGILRSLPLRLTEEEQEKLKASARTLGEVQSKLKF